MYRFCVRVILACHTKYLKYDSDFQLLVAYILSIFLKLKKTFFTLHKSGYLLNDKLNTVFEYS